MSTSHHIIARVHATERRLTRDIHEQQRRWHYRVHRGRVWFDEETRRAHQQLKQGVLAFLRHSSVLNLLTTPIIYSLGLPLVLLDAWATIYQWWCFPIYDIARVPRRRYFVIDRHKLAYLNAIEKLHCAYCSYATGVLAYVREIAACTEQYWCPVKHARPIRSPHAHYQLFLDYGDASGYRQRLGDLRRTITPRRDRTIASDTPSPQRRAR